MNGRGEEGMNGGEREEQWSLNEIQNNFGREEMKTSIGEGGGARDVLATEENENEAEELFPEIDFGRGGGGGEREVWWGWGWWVWGGRGLGGWLRKS